MRSLSRGRRCRPFAGALTRACAILLCTLLVIFSRPARAADPIDPKQVPEPLKPWVAWALDGKDDAACPQLVERGDATHCAWPSRLDLTLDEHGGTFSQAWHVDGAASAGRWVPLPGDAKRWPGAVKVDGKPAVALLRGGAPSVALRPGDHVVAGAFAWDSLPESLHVPPETGLLGLTLRGAAVPWPNRDAQGALWLQKSAVDSGAKSDGNALEIVVHRKVADGVPIVLTTRVELHVAGKNREELLGRALPAGFLPMALDSPLPARVEPDGRLRVQVRPGIYTLELRARSEGPSRALARPAPDGPWREGEEVWVFEAKNDLRIVTVEGVPSIDPQQTTLPDAWKALPAYPMKVGDTLVLDEKRRGDSDPPPNQLSLVRSLWLDFDGTGYAVSDELTGTLNRDSRLTMVPPTMLGRVAVGGRDQFITHLDDASQTGIEVRQGELSVTADSRIPGDPSDIPAVGWAHDFHQVSASLHLPPGWRLFHASGVDEVDGTWVKRWTLLELFLALIVAIGIGRLYGLRWGAIALAMLFLTLPEDDAPRWSWLFVLAVEGLLRVLPPGRVKKLFEGASRRARRRRHHHRALSHPARARGHLPGARERHVRRRRRGRASSTACRGAARSWAPPHRKRSKRRSPPPQRPLPWSRGLPSRRTTPASRHRTRVALPPRLRRRRRLRASTTGSRTRRCTTRRRSCRRDRVCPAGRGRSSTFAGAGPSPRRSGSTCISSRPTRTSCSRCCARRCSSWCSSGWRRGRSVSFRAAGRRRRSLCSSRVRRSSRRVRRAPTCRTRPPSTSSRRD